MSIALTNDQKVAQDYISEFIARPFNADDPDSYLCTLCGSAGTGKTTLTKLVVNMVRRSGRQVLCVAPTHKARKVLDSIVNTSSFLRIPTSTVAGLLGKMRAHGYVGTQHYKKGLDTKIGTYDFFIVDEISMVTTSDYQEIVQLAKLYEKKVLFVGDHLQIPNPSQQYKLSQNSQDAPAGAGVLIKEINPAFHEPHQLRLNQVVRVKNRTNLLSLLELVRDRVGTGFDIAKLAGELASGASGEPRASGYTIIPERDQFLKAIKAKTWTRTGSMRDDGFTSGQYRVICYTNSSVKQYNGFIRSALRYTDDVVVGELLTGYNNVGPNNDLIIENGQDYFVVAIKSDALRSISANGKTFEGLVGKILSITERSTSASNDIFLLDLHDQANFDVLEELVDLAVKVNRKGSTKADYRNYITLKSQLVFMEDLYRYKDVIYTGTEFKLLHPLLFTKTTMVITTRGDPIPSDLTGKIEQHYPDLLNTRVTDAKEQICNKEICNSETLADMYQVLERDISYGYALTAHKSQGSTYHTVFIDETDFNSLKDCWSWQHRMDIRRATERDQLKYVALSRATDECYIHSTA